MRYSIPSKSILNLISKREVSRVILFLYVAVIKHHDQKQLVKVSV